MKTAKTGMLGVFTQLVNKVNYFEPVCSQEALKVAFGGW